MQQRVQIGKNFDKHPDWKVKVGALLIYIPLLITVPLVAIGILMKRKDPNSIKIIEKTLSGMKRHKTKIRTPFLDSLKNQNLII